jgi:hypothetical protein
MPRARFCQSRNLAKRACVRNRLSSRFTNRKSFSPTPLTTRQVDGNEILRRRTGFASRFVAKVITVQRRKLRWPESAPITLQRTLIVGHEPAMTT